MQLHFRRFHATNNAGIQRKFFEEWAARIGSKPPLIPLPLATSRGSQGGGFGRSAGSELLIVALMAVTDESVCFACALDMEESLV